MIFYDEELSKANGNDIYRLNHEDTPIEIIKFEKRIVKNDKVCYVIVATQGDKYYMLGAKYLEEFIGFEINKSDMEIIEDYFKTYEIEKAIRLSRKNY